MNLKALLEIPPWEWPPKAAKEILKVLQDPTAAAADRDLAVELAGDSAVINDLLAAALLALVGDESVASATRAAAAIALGPALEEFDLEGLDSPETVAINQESFHQIQTELRRVYEDLDAPQKVRRCALEAAVRADGDWQAAAVRQAYADPDENWRLTAVYAMRFVSGFHDQILASLTDTNGSTLRKGVRRLSGRPFCFLS